MQTKRVYLVCWFRTGYRGPSCFLRFVMWNRKIPGGDGCVPPRHYFLGSSERISRGYSTATEHWHTNPWLAFWYASRAQAASQATLRACKRSCGFVGLMEADVVYDSEAPGKEITAYLDQLASSGRKT